MHSNSVGLLRASSQSVEEQVGVCVRGIVKGPHSESGTCIMTSAESRTWFMSILGLWGGEESGIHKDPQNSSTPGTRPN